MHKIVTIAVIALLLFTGCQKELDNPPDPAPNQPQPVVPTVVLLSFSPDSVQVGEVVLLKGRNFDTAMAKNLVTVNGTNATVLQASDTALQVRINTGTTTGKITLVSGTQTVMSTTDLRIYTAPAVPWVQKADFPVFLSSSIDVNGLVLSFNSATKGYIFKFNKLWQYDPASNAWSQKADLPSTKQHNLGLCFTIGDKAYIGLGSGGPGSPANTMSKEIWEYEMATDKWTRKADFPGVQRAACFSFSAGNLGYMGGGDTTNSNQGAIKDFWRYNPQSDSWTKLMDYPGAQAVGYNGFALGTTGYVFEGAYGTLTAPLTSRSSFRLWSYNTQSGAWQQKASLNMPAKPATSASVFALNGAAYAAVGMDTVNVNGQIQKNDFWAYNPQADQWIKKADVGGPLRWFPCSFAVGGKGYVGMGTGNTVFVRHKDFWQYNP